MHQKHCFHHRRRNPNPKLSISSFGVLHLGHFRTTEKQQKGRHSHSMADIRRASVPSQNLGIVNKKNSVLQGSKQEFSNLSHKTQESDHQYNWRDDRRFVTRRSRRDRQDKTWHSQIRDWDKIHLLHVSRRSTSFIDHANQKMVKHILPQIHPKASTGVFARHLLKNDRSSVFQTRPKPNRNA